MGRENQPDAVLDLLLKSAVDASERMSDLECRVCVANLAIHILVNAHPDKDALRAHFKRAYIAMQESAAAQRNPQQTFVLEQLLERLFGTIE
jgi:hypothetical protein